MLFCRHIKQKRKKEDVKENIILEVLCNHNDCHEYFPNDNKSYFAQIYYDSNPHAPRHCFKCGPTKVLGIDIKVNEKNPVHQCNNSKNMKQPCNHAFCNDCFILKKAENQQTNKRVRKKIKLYDYVSNIVYITYYNNI